MSGQGRWRTHFLVLVAAGLPQLAEAAPRRVAILNGASNHAAGTRAASTLRRALMADPELSPLAVGDLSRALEGPVAEESETDQGLRLARAEIDAMSTALARFDLQSARSCLSRAEQLLLELQPDQRVFQLLAEVSLQAGLLELRAQNRQGAVDAFRMVHRLQPNRPRLDPARFPPEVLSAFAAAAVPAQEATIAVTTTYDGVPIYLDGVHVGETPLRMEVASGPHYLWAAAAQLQPRGRKLHLAARNNPPHRLELEPLPLARRAADLRRALAAAPGPRREALRRAGREAAVLAAVDAVLVVTDGATGPLVAVYDRSDDRLSLFRPVDREVGRLFGLLVPAPAPAFMDLQPAPEPEDSTPWYRRPTVVISLSSNVVLAAAVVVLTMMVRDRPTPGPPVRGEE